MTEEITNDNWHRRHNTMRCRDKNVINNKISSFSHSTPELKIFLPPVITCNNFSLFPHFPAFTTHRSLMMTNSCLPHSEATTTARFYHCRCHLGTKSVESLLLRKISFTKILFIRNSSTKRKTKAVALCVRRQTAKRESRNRGKFSLHGTTGEKPENFVLCATHCLHQHKRRRKGGKMSKQYSWSPRLGISGGTSGTEMNETYWNPSIKLELIPVFVLELFCSCLDGCTAPFLNFFAFDYFLNNSRPGKSFFEAICPA